MSISLKKQQKLTKGLEQCLGFQDFQWNSIYCYHCDLPSPSGGVLCVMIIIVNEISNPCLNTGQNLLHFTCLV